MENETPIRAVITNRFDLGFILQHPNGEFGQLRVPEMSGATAELDRSSNNEANILGTELEVFIIHKLPGEYLFSEFSSVQRAERERLKELKLKKQEQAEIGRKLKVQIEFKLPWGCICREVGDILEGVILTESTIKEKEWHKPQLGISEEILASLSVGDKVDVIIGYKECAHWHFMVYFSYLSK